MNRVLDNSWFRSLVLLGALSVGTMLTQVVPSYEEMASLRERPTTMPSTSAVRDNRPSDVTGIDVDQRHLTLVRSIA